MTFSSKPLSKSKSNQNVNERMATITYRIASSMLIGQEALNLLLVEIPGESKKVNTFGRLWNKKSTADIQN